MKGNTTSFLRKLGQATMLKTYILVLYTCVCDLCNHQFWLEATNETTLPSFGWKRLRKHPCLVLVKTLF
jgi:hypothetical protein